MIGDVSEEARQLVEVTRECLYKGALNLFALLKMYD